MPFNLASLLGLLPMVGPAIAAASEFKAVFEAAKSLLGEDDQAVAQEAYEDLMAENDAGFARLEAKLEAAKNR